MLKYWFYNRKNGGLKQMMKQECDDDEPPDGLIGEASGRRCS